MRQKTISLKEYRISIGCVALSGILLFISYGVPFFLPRRLFVNNEFEEHIQYMKEKDLHYGLGSFWYSTPITALSRGESDVMTINMKEDGYIAKGIGRSPQFSEMKNYCNFFLEDIDTPYGMTEERIVKNWGEYVEKKDFLKADEQPHSRIYSYDYDIRWLPVVVYEDIDFRKQKKWKISASMPLGKVRIVFEGSELQDISFSTDAECGMKLIENNNSKMVFELDFLQDTEVKLNLIADNQEALITKTSYYVVNAYQDVYADNGDKTQDAISFDLPSGEYFVFIEGDDIKDVEYTLYSQQDENIVLETQKGKIQQRLKVSVEQDTVVTLIGEKMDKIRRISYTNPCTSIPVELITIGALECYE